MVSLLGFLVKEFSLSDHSTDLEYYILIYVS